MIQRIKSPTQAALQIAESSLNKEEIVHTMRKFANPKANKVYVEKTLTEASKVFGVDSNALGYKAAAESDDDVILCSIFPKTGTENG